MFVLPCIGMSTVDLVSHFLIVFHKLLDNFILIFTSFNEK